MDPHKNDRQKDLDDLPELPPLEDDGSLFDIDEPLVPERHDDHDLDDSTGEDAPHELFGAFVGIDEEGSLLDGAEGNDLLVVTDDRDLLAGAEAGLLEDSDEGDGRSITADEAGVVDDDASFADDGGAEGTGEDPSAALEPMPGELHVGEASDDEGIEDDARFEDVAAMRARQRLEREPWPRRADASWVISRADPAHPFEGGVSGTSDRDLVVATRDGALIVSRDGGATFTRVPGCTGVTTAAILASRRQRAIVAALHDSTRDTAAVVLVRVERGLATGVERELAPELVADLIADEVDEDVRITSLHVRTRREGRDEIFEVLARGAFGAVLLTPRARKLADRERG
ncbi:MAG: hypothetical protein HYV09_03600 [Deltaproteobacteria bacterium]|nr:hypothetical protein [Deltaproteobacteria bacterium]